MHYYARFAVRACMRVSYYMRQHVCYMYERVCVCVITRGEDREVLQFYRYVEYVDLANRGKVRALARVYVCVRVCLHDFVCVCVCVYAYVIFRAWIYMGAML